MTVVLLILKIIGILLLVLLALIFLVLFVPVCYRAKGSYHSALTLTVRVSALMRLFLFGLDMQPGQNDAYLRIFGFKKILTKTDNTEEFEDTIEEIIDDGAIDAAEEAKEAADEFVHASVEKKQREETEIGDGNGTGEDLSSDEEKTKTQEAPFPMSFIQKIRNLFSRIRAAVVRFFAVKERIQRLWDEEANRQALRFLVGRLVLLLRRFAPKKIALTMTYSTGAADTTAKLFGVLALFPFPYRARWNITPDFTADSFYADAEFDVRGRIFLYQLAGIALSVLLDKNCRNLYNEIKNGS